MFILFVKVACISSGNVISDVNILMREEMKRFSETGAGQGVREVSCPCGCRAEQRGTCVFTQVSLGGVSHPAVPKATEHLLSQPEPVMPNTALLVKNPLASTHLFKQACHICYPKTGDAFALPPEHWHRLGIGFPQADGVILSGRAQGW